MDNEMSKDQYRKLESQLAAEEMKLTIMKKMRQQQSSSSKRDGGGGARGGGGGSGSGATGGSSGPHYADYPTEPKPKQHRPDRSTEQRSGHAGSAPTLAFSTTHVPPLQSSRTRAYPPAGAVPPPPPEPYRQLPTQQKLNAQRAEMREQAYRHHHHAPAASPLQHRRSPHIKVEPGRSRSPHFKVEPGMSRSQPDLVTSGGEHEAEGNLPPPPPLRHLNRSEMRAAEQSRFAAVPSPNSPPSLMPRSQLERESHAAKSAGGGSVAHHHDRGDASAYHAHSQAAGTRGRGPPAPPMSLHSATGHNRDYVTQQTHAQHAQHAQLPTPYKLEPGHSRHTVAPPPSAKSARSELVHDVVTRLGDLFNEREQYARLSHIPNRPPQYSWSTVPTVVPSSMLSIIGMDECVQRLEAFNAGVPWPDPTERLEQTHRPVCAHCKSDFAPFWRSFKENNSIVIVCENCDWMRVKRPFIQQHASRLQESTAKVDSLSKEMADLEAKARVKLVQVDR